MLIDLRNTEYYKAKHFSLKQDIFGGNHPELTEEEKDRVANLNLASTLGGLTAGTGIYAYLAGRKMKKLKKDHTKEFIEDRVKNGKRIIPGAVPMHNGSALRGAGILLTSTGLAGVVASQLLKKKLLDEKKKEKEKSFAITPPITKAATARRMGWKTHNNKNPMNQNGRAATTQAVTQREVQKAQFVQKNEGMRAQRQAAKIQASNASQATRKGIAAQKSSDIQNTNFIRTKELEQRRISQAGNNIIKPNLNNLPPVVPMNG
jgi:hypothetical protein